ncbi:hypothetical protein [Pseudonocardia spinosispora]|uniref:hypothetical protein n=1 Tax=Pseudonocardia spinosispora TaxID=103441 RepID=UPI000422C470|nr:hypothetical protein [Pseudonocardia spinosispora]
MSGTDERILSHGIMDDGAPVNAGADHAGTGHADTRAATTEPATATDGRSHATAAEGSTSGAALIDPTTAKGYQARWDDLKGQFVDDPRHVVRGVDELVSDVLEELERTFRTQRGNLESGVGEEASTEELRIAFGKYREFFDRLLSL